MKMSLLSAENSSWEPKLKPHSQADISKSLARLGFGSWATLEPSKLSYLVYIFQYLPEG